MTLFKWMLISISQTHVQDNHWFKHR
uniref:Uncharacterized protein n=1 Tax=Anguilla anguilla TaxID=7936 RepID=A0A0E9U944_ANGAN